MELHNDVKTFHAITQKEWRKWLEEELSCISTIIKKNYFRMDTKREER